MKRFRRILFNTLTAISLLLAIATAAVWARSSTFSEEWTFKADRLDSRTYHYSYLLIGSSRGQGYFSLTFISDSTAPWRFEALKRSALYGSVLERTFPSRSGFWMNKYYFGNGRFVTGAVPYWFVTISLLVLPGIKLVRASRTSSRVRRGHCPACGYDMRVSPAKCSECGHEPKAVAA